MKIKLGVLRKIISAASSILLLVNSFTPYLLIAPVLSPVGAQEEISPTQEPIITPTETITAEPTATPTVDATATPTVEASPTIEVTPVETIAPTEIPTLAPTEAPSVPSPPEEGLINQTPTATPGMDVQPSPTPEVLQSSAAIGTVETQVVESYSCRADSLNGCLATDKADYAPTDVAIITGYGFAPNTSYTLRVYSTDEPAVNVSYQITTDANGSFTYSYQLDGTYRPNYLVELKDLAGFVVATVTFTDSHIGSHVCVTDVQGADDEPGQKDLTQMCYDYSGLTTSIASEWNWDDTSWSGSNTGDACALFDTDGDGNANYATCVTVEDGPPATQKSGSPRVFSCNDTRADRCAGDSLISGPYSTNCNVSQVTNQPFASGSDTPNDTNASCTIYMSEVGGGSAQLVDVCSFPSDEPNSDPSDCIRAAARTGKLEVVKDLSPSSDSGRFNLQIDGSTVAANAGDGGTTGEQIVSVGDHSVGETAGTSTSLANYSTSISCKDLNGTGSVVASSNNVGPLTVNVTDGVDIVCTIANNVNSGTLKVYKVTDPSSDTTTEFEITATGSGTITGDVTQNVTGGSSVDYEVQPGTYSVSEADETGWDETGNTCTDVVVSPNQTAECTITNTKRGQIIVEKQTLPDGSPQSFDFTADYDGDGFSLTDGQQNDSGFLAPGSYTVGETVPTGWDLTGIVCTDPTQNSSGNLPTSPTATVNLAAGETVTCVFTNTQRGHIIVDKVTNPSGSDQSFDFDATGSGYIDFSLTDAATPNDQEVVPGSYSVSEGAVSGWDQTSATCDQDETVDSIDVGAGETVTCTFTNTKRGSISGYKYEDQSGDTSDDGDQTPVQGLLVELWQWVTNTFVDTGKTDTTDSNGFYEFLDLIPGVYQVREILSSLGAAWTNVTSTEIDVTVDPGESDEDNNFINTRYGTIVVEKQTVPDGDQTLFDFDLSYGDNDADLSDGQQDSTGNLLPGSYSVSENTPEGWVLTDTSCTSSIDDTETADDLELDSGETITCVFTNSRKPTLTLVKTVTNNNGGTAVASDFQGKINGGNVPWSVAQTLNPGSYTASETTLSNYTASVWGTNCNADGTITLAYGDNKTCSITNDDNAPALHLRKTITTDNGGTALITDWTLTATGTGDTPTNLSGSTPVDSGSGFKADTYTLGESGGPSGYTAGKWGCGLATMTDPTHVVVPFGGDVTCTINNDDNAPSLTLNKVVVNDNGGNALESNWTLTATGPTSISGTGATGDSDVVSDSTFDAGTYTLSESTGPTGYTASSWVCTGGSQNGNEITIDLGESATCTITNNDIAPTITLIKEVVNDDGGEAGAGDFTLSLGNNTVTSGVATTVDANTAYEIDEAGPFGYQFVSITGDPECPGALAGNVTADEGENITCTITNDDIAPTLKLVKEVMTDNGGTAVADDWSLNATAYPNDSRNFNNLGGSGNFETVFANVGYDLSESSVSGYSAGGWNCDGGNLLGSTVTLGLNENVTCTITNDDETGRLVVVKVLINDDGGDLNNEDFSYTVNDGISTPFESDGQNEESVDSGNYTVVEDEVTGYETTYENCDDVFVANGGSATCTITNNDIAPTLKLVKSVTNDDGGDADPADWDLTASGNGGFTDGGDSTTFHTVKANEPYTLSESTVDGYAEGSWDCDNAGLQGNVVLLGPSEEVTCTITNDDIAPTITLIKEVIGGTAGVDDFSLYLGGNSVTSGVVNTVLANSFYDIDEDGPSGYSFTSITGDPECPEELREDFEVAEGENISCTITNTRDTGSLEVNKQVDTDGDGVFEGGNTEANGLGFVWGIDSETPDRAMGSTASPLDTGSYEVDENNVPDYHFAGWYFSEGEGSCENPDETELPANIDVEKDSTTSITLCNARDMGTITVDKVTDPTEALDEFTINLNQGLAESPTLIHSSVLADQTLPDTYTIPTGEYWFQELDKTGWDLTDANCIVNEDIENNFDPRADSFNLDQDMNLTCTFTNTQRGKVIVTKYSDNNGDGNQDEGENALPDWLMNLDQVKGSSNQETTGEDGKANFNNVLPGSYILSEETQNSYQLTNISCSTDEGRGLDTSNEHELSVVAGQTTTCEIGNQPVNPELQISKSNDGVNKSPGGTVIYTLKLKVLNSKALGVKIKDLLPKGFTFDHVVSSTLNGAPITLGDPGYSSPGTYNLGDLNANDEVIIQYQAKIDGGQEFGLYKDIAWAQGTDLLANKVLALAQPEGFVDTNFVGTAVRVDGNITEGGNTSLQGEVLGASTQRILPATGGNQIWVIIASVLSVLGLLVVLIGLMLKKKKTFVVLLLVIGYLLVGALVGSVNAANLSIRVSEPKTPTKNTDFKMVFTVLDLTESGSAITAKCFYKKNLADAWTQFDSDKAISAGGNTDSCQVNGSIVNTSGQTYYFKATATNGADSDDSEAQGLIAVGYDDRDPSVPTNYKKEKISDCQYKISFKTADDGQTSRVEIYRSDSTSFNLDGSTRVGDVTVGPNTESSFTESVPDCGKTYYYVIRAFNSAGNASGPTGDSGVTTTTTTTTTTTEEGGAVPVEGVALPGGAGGGEVLGEKTEEATPTAKPEVVEVKKQGVEGAVKGVADFVKKKTKLSLLIVAGLLALGYGIYYFIKKKRQG